MTRWGFGWRFVFAILAITSLPVMVLTADHDFANTDFVTDTPFTYDHSTDGGAYNNRTLSDFGDSNREPALPFLKIEERAGRGETLLIIRKSVTTANGICGADDAEFITVAAGDTVKYCYVITNSGSGNLFDLDLTDDNGTPFSEADDFSVSLFGLSDLDGEGDADDLGAGESVRGEALVMLNSGCTVNIPGSSDGLTYEHASTGFFILPQTYAAFRSSLVVVLMLTIPAMILALV